MQFSERTKNTNTKSNELVNEYNKIGNHLSREVEVHEN